MRYDVAVIGAGVVGLCIAYELSKYKISTICIEKEPEIATGASGNNSGVIHSGINLKPGSRKAELCVKGNRLMYELCDTLNVPFKRTGTLVVALNEEEFEIIEELRRRAELNHIRGVTIVEEEEIRKIEPYLRGRFGLHSATGGIVLPRTLCKKLADDAVANGVKLLLNSQVSAINGNHNDEYRIKMGREYISANIVVNAAGLYSDEIASMVAFDRYTIQPWIGEYYVLNSSKNYLVNSMVYPAPQFGKPGLGIHLTKTLDDRVIVGPNAKRLEHKNEIIRSPREEFHAAIARFLPDVKPKDLEYGYSGVRAKLAGSESVLDADFIIEEQPERFVQVMGIESPGLTASPAIAKEVVLIVAKHIDLH